MTIGELAGASGVAISTVRFYERQGLVDPDRRTPAGYRLYDDETVRRVRFIRRAQELGFTLREVRDVLRLSEQPELIAFDDVAGQVAAKLDELERRIAELGRVRDALALLVETGPTHPRCPVVEALA
ncbi:heavy metal-responsive transcriptional regulator [Agromyces sp. NPDC058136]|uniref:heavy metal-responsive transcriptional regulator n=1 Tax=Agromyces sp. NPDC058136 TaxID=3346354 RepID=UPI0036DBA6BD